MYKLECICFTLVIAWRASVSKGKEVKVQKSNACNLDAINLANDIDDRCESYVAGSGIRKDRGFFKE